MPKRMTRAQLFKHALQVVAILSDTEEFRKLSIETDNVEDNNFVAIELPEGEVLSQNSITPIEVYLGNKQICWNIEAKLVRPCGRPAANDPADFGTKLILFIFNHE